MAEPPPTPSDTQGDHLTKAEGFGSNRFRGLRDGWRSIDWRSVWQDSGRVLAAAFGVALLLSAALALVMMAFAPEIPAGADLYALNRPQALTFTDEKGNMIGVRGAIVGDRLKLSEMPRYLPAAFLAMEDRNFYHHSGIDPNALMRAAFVDLRAGHIVQGGSTITQQVVKIVLLSPDRTFSRKIREIAGAFALENKLSKDEILELYLNRLYLGSGAYGVDGAAKVYFGTSARNVTLPQAAMLAALTRAPSAFSPRRDLASAQMRAGKVLDAMVETGAITKEQADAARAHPATVIDPTENLARDYFLDAAADEVKAVAPYASGDLTITTTMDPALQEAARAQIATVLNRKGARSAHATQAALVSMATDGAVRALIGGKDYAESAFNRVTKAHRQPGSAFKPFVYLAALESGLTPSTVRVDEPIAIQDKSKVYAPDNYTATHVGPISLHEAFAQSINTVAVQLGLEVGLPRVVSTAHRLGIESPLQPVASIALGTSEVTPLELTAAYASFATLGMRVQPYMVTEIRKPDDTVLYRHNPAMQTRVLAEADGLAMNEMMYEVVQSGTGRGAAVPGHEVAGKTGTSADFRDAWFIGFSPELVTGVWVGNDDFTPMKKVTGGSLPAQIWSSFMRTALKNVPPTPLPRAAPPPPDITDGATATNDENAIQQGIEGLGNGIGSFFSHLFGGGSASSTAPSSTRRERSSDASNGRHFFPEESDSQFTRNDSDRDTPPVAPVTPSPAERPQMPQSSSAEQVPNTPVPRVVLPPPSHPAPEQRATRNEENGPTFVFQNGETGERQVFRGGSRGDTGSGDHFAYRDRDYPPPPPPRFAPPPRYDFPPPRYDNAPRYGSPAPPPSDDDPPQLSDRDAYPDQGRATRPDLDFPDR